MSSAKSLVGKLQPNIESLDKNWTFFSLLLLSGFNFVCSCWSYTEPWKSDHFYFLTRLQASLTTKPFFMVLQRVWQTFEKLLSHPVSDDCLLEFFCLLSSLFLKEIFMPLPRAEAHSYQLHSMFNKCFPAVSKVFIFTEQCLPEVRFKAYFIGKLQINHRSNRELIKLSLETITFIDAWHQNFCCRTRQLIRKKKKK